MEHEENDGKTQARVFVFYFSTLPTTKFLLYRRVNSGFLRND